MRANSAKLSQILVMVEGHVVDSLGGKEGGIEDEEEECDDDEDRAVKRQTVVDGDVCDVLLI